MGMLHTSFPPFSMKTVHGINRFVGFKRLYKSGAFEDFLDEYPKARKRWNVIRPVLDGKLTEEQSANAFHVSARTIRRWKKSYDRKNWYSLLPKSRRPHSAPREEIPLERKSRVIQIANKYPAWGAPKIHDYIRLNDPIDKQIGERTVSRILVKGIQQRDIEPRVKLKTYVKQRRDMRGRTINRIKDSTRDVAAPGERVHNDGVVVHIYNAGRELLKKLYFSCHVDRYSKVGMVTVGDSLDAELTIKTHKKIRMLLGVPICEKISDNGGENLGDCIKFYEKNNVIQLFTYPHAPKQNAVAERFNRTFQEECLLGKRIDLTQPIEIIQEEINAWLIEYNTERPHEALGGIPPILALFLWKWKNSISERDKENYHCGQMLWRGTQIGECSLNKLQSSTRRRLKPNALLQHAESVLQRLHGKQLQL